ncbi:MAG: type II toxin-antitoxin system PemK/MazF family toxin [Armatimonadota bacterium]
MSASLPCRGEVWLATLDPTRGPEQAGQRPALVISVDTYNHGPAGMVIVVPITSRNWGIPLHVRVNPPEGGLTQSSVILCDHIRSIAKERLLRRLGVVSAEIVAQVEERLLVLLDL